MYLVFLSVPRRRIRHLNVKNNWLKLTEIIIVRNISEFDVEISNRMEMAEINNRMLE